MMGLANITSERNKKYSYADSVEKLKGRNHLRCPGEDRRAILKLIAKKPGVKRREILSHKTYIYLLNPLTDQ
jgi:hypothetical protein